MRRASDAYVQSIRAAVLRKRGGPLKLEFLEMEGPRDDEILVRIVASGICHTDIRYIDDWYEEEEGPLVLGHEGAGVVERVGGKVKTVRRGDRVVLSYPSCGHCRPCRSSHPAACTAAYVAGANGRESLPEGRKSLYVVQGDAVPQVFIPKLIELYRKGLFPFERLENVYAFGQINRAIADARCGRTIKPVLSVGEG